MTLKYINKNTKWSHKITISHHTKRNSKMSSKHMKRRSTSYVIRKMQIKATMKYHYIPIRRPKSGTLTTPKAG